MKLVISHCFHCPFGHMQDRIGGTKYCLGVYWLGDRTELRRYFDDTVEVNGRQVSAVPSTPPIWCPLKKESFSVELVRVVV